MYYFKAAVIFANKYLELDNQNYWLNLLKIAARQKYETVPCPAGYFHSYNSLIVAVIAMFLMRLAGA